MIFHETISHDGCRVSISRWKGPGRREVHAVITPEVGGRFEVQLERVKDALAFLTSDRQDGVAGLNCVMTRLHVSDIANQSESVGEIPAVEQLPAGGGKLTALAVFTECDGEAVGDCGQSIVRRGPYTDVRHCLEASRESDTYEATKEFFNTVCESLARRGTTLGESCVRTWFFVHDIDRHYSGLVRARNEIFGREGLTRTTRFIASTGIGANLRGPQHSESLSVLGLRPGQMRHLTASERMNSTADYGVAFERATCVDYGDRRLTYVSGTASIGPAGEIVHEGDIKAQTARMMDNVEALLSQGGASGSDLQHYVVYVRDYTDVPEVETMVGKRFPGVPGVVVQGPVCRPGWLVEMECMAMTPYIDIRYAPY